MQIETFRHFRCSCARLTLVFALAACVQPASAKDVDAIAEQIQSGDHAAALPRIKAALANDPDNFYQLYNLGLAHYMAGDYEDAIVAWERVRFAQDPELVTRAMAQIGHASYRLGERMDSRSEERRGG